jgi:hypothetical protein
MSTGAANAIRQLRAGERPPPGNPVGRYRNADGYVRLRWQTGPRSYVESYEHRHVAQPPDGMRVHHRGARDDNRPRALLTVTPAEHARQPHQGVAAVARHLRTRGRRGRGRHAGVGQRS